MKIMLVDDSKTMRNVQKSVLTQLGYNQFEEACDGLDALTKVNAVLPDLILLDWNMPNMDGLTFVQKYRGSGGKASIIMVTTEAEKARVITAIKAGVNNYVIKPFTPELLGERITETLSRIKVAA
jgi:two-component system chemotaxis response regulator CheY